jgi:hypothetical protein
MDVNSVRKALDIAAGSSAYLIPLVIDEAIRDYVSKEPVLYNAVTKMPWATNTYFVRKRTANPTASWATDGGSLPSATNTTHVRVAVPVAYLYTRGEVTGPLQRAAGSLIDALALEIEAHSRILAEKLSTDLATGDGTGNGIKGIYQQITDADGASAASTVTTSGALTLAAIDSAIDASLGQVDLIVAGRAVKRKINSLLVAQQRFMDQTEIAAGFRVMTYDGIPIVTDLHDEKSDKIAFVRRSDAKLLVHQDFTYEELAKTKDSTDFMIKGYFGFALEGRPTVLSGFTAVS